MRRFTALAATWLLLAMPTYSQSGFTIELKQKSRPEQQTKDQLERLLGTYDIQQWIFTKSILIDDTAIPHSHPVLTLSTRHIKDDELLLSTFIHEQFHWWASGNNDGTQKSIAELRGMFPKVPVGVPGRRSRREFDVSSFGGVLSGISGDAGVAGRIQVETDHGILGNRPLHLDL
jgi:hypothetical protein